MKYKLLKISLALIAAVSAFSFSANADNGHTIITMPVSEFSEIRIIGISSDYSRSMWGYPGITIVQSENSWGSVSYNQICSDYIKTKVEGGVLTVTVDCKFLSPRSGWNPADGIIDAITISVPEKVKLKSIVNEGEYYTNMSLVDVKLSSLSITASNRVNLLNCKIGDLSWTPFDGRPLARMCEYNFSLTCTNVGKLLIPSECASSFRLNNTYGSKVKVVEWTKLTEIEL